MKNTKRRGYIDAEQPGRKCFVEDITYSKFERTGYIKVIGDRRPAMSACVQRIEAIDRFAMEIRVYGVANEEYRMICAFNRFADGWAMRVPPLRPPRHRLGALRIPQNDVIMTILGSTPAGL